MKPELLLDAFAENGGIPSYYNWNKFKIHLKYIGVTEGTIKEFERLAVLACEQHKKEIDEDKELFSKPDFLRSLADAIEGNVEEMSLEELKESIGVKKK